MIKKGVIIFLSFLLGSASAFAQGGQSIVIIPQVEHLRGEGMLVNEVDAFRIRPSMKAIVRPVALPGVELPGRVRSVSFQAFDKNEKLGHLALKKAGKAGVSVVEVEVELLENDPRVKLGFTAMVEIVLEEIPSAVLVPASAILHEGDQAYCLTADGRKKRVKVVGSNELARAVEGLEEGEEIARDALKALGRTDPRY